MKPKSYQSQMKQNNSTEFVGLPFKNIYNKKDPPEPLDPKSSIFRISQFFYSKSTFFKVSRIDQTDLEHLSARVFYPMRMARILKTNVCKCEQKLTLAWGTPFNRAQVSNWKKHPQNKYYDIIPNHVYIYMCVYLLVFVF